MTYKEIKELISDTLKESFVSLSALNDALREYDPLKVGPTGAKGLVPLNPVVGSDWDDIGLKVEAPFKHLSNIDIALSKCHSDEMYCQVLKEAIDCNFKVNAMSELGGDVGEFTEYTSF